ncbi:MULTISPECIES: hypothetical protein [Prevotellaceae]|uniref:hypothetical protein n=1 Tax=Prevotellaceae TaxID=171552 RepID=UPI00055EDD2C|nr:hypothetical protein [Prevotella phocaeensis]
MAKNNSYNKHYTMDIIRIVYLAVCCCILYIKIKKNPSVQVKEQDNIKEGDTSQEPSCESSHLNSGKEDNMRDKEDLKYTLETVNSWVNNCDQKTNILLSIMGMAITILLSSYFVIKLRQIIFAPFIQYWTGKETNMEFSFGNFCVFILLLLAVSFLIKSCYYLFKTIGANIDYAAMYNTNPQLPEQSHLFFNTISRMSYRQFQDDNIDIKEDLKAQIYVNSKIATNKFENYKRGMFWLKVLLIPTVMLFISIMIM